MNASHLSAARWPHLPVFVRPSASLVSELLGAPAERAATSNARPLPINVWSDAQALHVEAEVPGLSIEDIELTVLGDELTIVGKQAEAPTPTEGTTMLREERRAGAFERRLALPFDVKADVVTAELRNGVLLVTLPRSEADVPRRIPVRSAGE